ncbi:NAD(P)-binding protein [Aulographum hederae CBS 113979]|uniref:NAD(P)-binding protein n=1 Tax=Aulographum hederae CBS 113979 TaxID=1176131 RepID=A0A6G1GSM0_9PEZI|nr:NAD(P)-binding protein [Aulographum hederae CBS 113979]
MASIDQTLNISDPVLPVGSLILVTGANGYLGSHVVDQLLKLGYKVRGSVRDIGRSQWMTEYFSKYGKENLELVIVDDFSATDAYDEALKGVAGVVHVASVLSMSPVAEEVIPPVIAATVNIYKAASKVPTVKRFVLTSSSAAAYMPVQGTKNVLGENSYNELAIGVSKSLKEPFPPEAGFMNYMASKALGERELWKVSKESNSDIVVNTVLPNWILGHVLHPAQGAPSSAGIYKGLIAGQYKEYFSFIGPQWTIDVQDAARLHVAGLLLPDVEGERLWAFGERFSYVSELALMRKVFPEYEERYPETVEGMEEWWDESVVPNERAEELLRGMGVDGWTRQETMVRRMKETIYKDI